MRFCVWISLGMLALAGCSSQDAPVAAPSSLAKTAIVQKGDLAKAVYRGDEALVRDLIARGADLNENSGTEQDEITPLLIAIVTQRKDIALVLIQAGAALHPSFQGYDVSDLTRHLWGPQSEVFRSLKGRK